jgi:putative tryptophan/tyrosine transport system substrate-binding protein
MPVRARRLPAALALIGLIAIAVGLPPAARAQAKRPVRIGALTASWGPTPGVVGLRAGLLERGYREPEDFVIGVRFTQGDLTAISTATRELVEQKVDILVVGTGAEARAAQEVTSRIPIVLIGGGDPVAQGLAKSFARPGGNLTGVVNQDELAPKRLEIFRGIVPGLKRVLFVHDPANPYTAHELTSYRDGARRLGLTLVERPVGTRDEARAALAGLRRREVNGILAPWEMSLNIPGLVLEAAARLSIPTMFPDPFYVEQGGLASYSPDHQESGRLAARLVDKIVRGTPPGDIPIELDNRIHFALNLKAARAIGLRVPPEMLLRTNRVID